MVISASFISLPLFALKLIRLSCLFIYLFFTVCTLIETISAIDLSMKKISRNTNSNSGRYEYGLSMDRHTNALQSNSEKISFTSVDEEVLGIGKISKIDK